MGTPDFSPSRLDFIVYSDSTANLQRAFALDTSHLTRRVLTKVGLRAYDTLASDHLPVVADIVPTQ